MQKYKCHKVVEAAKITSVSPQYIAENEKSAVVDVVADGETFTLPIVRNSPSIGDYVVRYEDGYLSWSPANPFEEGYTLLAAE